MDSMPEPTLFEMDAVGNVDDIEQGAAQSGEYGVLDWSDEIDCHSDDDTKTFEPFPRLPFELRALVWKISLPDVSMDPPAVYFFSDKRGIEKYMDVPYTREQVEDEEMDECGDAMARLDWGEEEEEEGEEEEGLVWPKDDDEVCVPMRFPVHQAFYVNRESRLAAQTWAKKHRIRVRKHPRRPHFTMVRPFNPQHDVLYVPISFLVGYTFDAQRVAEQLPSDQGGGEGGGRRGGLSCFMASHVAIPEDALHHDKDEAVLLLLRAKQVQTMTIVMNQPLGFKRDEIRCPLPQRWELVDTQGHEIQRLTRWREDLFDGKQDWHNREREEAVLRARARGQSFEQYIVSYLDFHSNVTQLEAEEVAARVTVKTARAFKRPEGTIPAVDSYWEYGDLEFNLS